MPALAYSASMKAFSLDTSGKHQHQDSDQVAGSETQTMPSIKRVRPGTYAGIALLVYSTSASVSSMRRGLPGDGLAEFPYHTINGTS